MTNYISTHYENEFDRVLRLRRSRLGMEDRSRLDVSMTHSDLAPAAPRQLDSDNFASEHNSVATRSSSTLLHAPECFGEEVASMGGDSSISDDSGGRSATDDDDNNSNHHENDNDSDHSSEDFDEDSDDADSAFRVFGELLSLDDVLLFKSLGDMPISFSHVGVLYLLSRDCRDGYVTRQHCSAFGTLLHCLKEHFRFSRDFQSALQSYGNVCLWRDVAADGGRPRCVEWFHNLILANSTPLKSFPEYPGTRFIFRDTVKTVHQVLRVYESFAIDLQAFFDLLQRTAEEMQLLSLSDERLDDWIPESVIRQFIARFFDGMGRMMTSLGFTQYTGSAVQLTASSAS
eukprot:ANDGO_05691.mRNA.1 hypothetical protein GUITHDRAFT_165322